ncbi:unnamed protein product [Penicillium roqueforti FM164]|uniref:Uncharacterized protein n=1 Tax=Penicillium roqueforti (strain FM164) TaxID=1365484 RepID=W6QWI9_PENRF|nr:unnamed protein product [Penicillium roqueforti FM164]
MIQLFGRFILKLPTTTLELFAGAIVICTFGTFICWMHKPSDVHTGIVLSMEVSTTEILLEAGDLAALPYRHDFIAKQSFTCSYDVMRFFGLCLDDRERPLRRFPNDRFPNIGTFFGGSQALLWDKYLIWLRLKKPPSQPQIDAEATVARQHTESNSEEEGKKYIRTSSGIINIWHDNFNLDRAQAALLASIFLYEADSKSAS